MKSGKVSVIEHYKFILYSIKNPPVGGKQEGSSKPMPRWKPKAFLWGSRSRSKKEEGGFILEPSK